LPIILLTYPAVTEKLKHIIKNFHNIFIYEETKSIFDNIELIKSSYLVISPDTSIIHIASGLNKPMIAFYGDGKENFTHWHPNSQNIVHLIQYKKNINEITPQQILPEWLV
ncbi:glycosyltransferase family 9 protein, partial [Frederiksenia canicola]